MNTRVARWGGAACVALLALAGGAWWQFGDDSGPSAPSEQAEDAPLPVPPVPPRIAEGDQYERCLAMLPADPAGASNMAEAWQAQGGGDAATHCLALSKIELGEPETGAKMLEALAAASHAPDAARGAVYDQADQAWLMAGDPAHAFGAATLALALSPDEADLLVNRAVTAGALDRFDDARDDLTHALEIDPKRTDALVLRGSAWRHLNHLDLAQDDIDRALDRDPDNVEGLLERGILRERGNDQVGARQDWEKAISLSPDSETADLAQQNLALLDAGPDQR